MKKVHNDDDEEDDALKPVCVSLATRRQCCTKEASYAILFLSYIIENCLLSKLYIYSPAVFYIVVMGLLTCKIYSFERFLLNGKDHNIEYTVVAEDRNPPHLPKKNRITFIVSNIAQ